MKSDTLSKPSFLKKQINSSDIRLRISDANYLSVTVFANFLCVFVCVHTLALGGRDVLLKQVKVSPVV